MPFITAAANLLGISVFRLIAYTVLAAAVTTGALAVRQHYINKGYASAIAAVKKQDDRAVAAATTVEKKAAACQDGINGYWDVITQICKLEDAP